jgi:SAM-dependent methyltransferase
MACSTCGMRFLAVQPSGESIEELYSAPYFQTDFRCGRSATGAFDEHAFAAENRGLLDTFAELGPSGRLLEVGSASGWLLKHALERGWEVQGVEPSAEAAAFARGLGLSVFHGDLLEAKLPGEHFDLVYMGDVLEHVPDCRAVVAEVARVLKRGGHLYLRGPITTHSLARGWALRFMGLLGRDIVLSEPPYHLWEFTPAPLTALLHSVGLQVVKLRQSKIPPGWVHGRKSLIERAVLTALDAINLPITAVFNARGDRIVVVARN